MSRGFTDWQNMGALPLQDHDIDGVETGDRQQIVGGRISFFPDADRSTDPSQSVTEYAEERGMGTLGDVHPWFYWGPEKRTDRDTGSWAQSFAAMVTGGTTGGFPPGGGTGRPVSAAQLHPLRNGVADADERYVTKFPGWPRCFPALPQGSLMVVMPGTKEDSQQEVMLHGDPRLFAVNVEGPAECGTLVCDLQPEGQACMDSSKDPGIGGRHARLQSMIRVVALGQGGKSQPGPLGTGKGNGLAWNLALGGVDGIAGYGLCFAQLDGGTVPTPTGPKTPGGGGGGTKPGASITHGGGKPAPPGGGKSDFRNRGASVSDPRFGRGGGIAGARFGGFGAGRGIGAGEGVGGGRNGGPVLEAGGGSGPCGFGKFDAKPMLNHGIGFMAQVGACGPFTVGAEGDKHSFGADKDGHPINSGHLSTNALFYQNEVHDAPLHFEDVYPNPPPLPEITRVHLSYDAGRSHRWCDGARGGLWRWWSEATKCCPDTKDPPVQHQTPRPSGPTTPRPGGPSPSGPSTPGGGGGGSGGGSQTTTPRSTGGGTSSGGSSGGSFAGAGFGGLGGPLLATTRPRVGSGGASDVSLYTSQHNMMEGYAAMSFRPQLWVKGRTSFVHNPRTTRDDSIPDEASRPQVLAMHAWGAVDVAAGDWSYVTNPDVSRARGGTGHGGILFVPPHLEMEDYFGINSDVNVRTLETVSYVTVAPGVAFALGTPVRNGALNPKSVTLAQDPADTTDDSFTIAQVNSSGVGVELIRGRVSQSSGEVLVQLAAGGSNGVVRLGDNVKLALGDASDATILFNGTDTIWDVDPLTAGANLRINNGFLGVGVDPLEEIHASSVIRADAGFKAGANTGIDKAQFTFDDLAGNTHTVTIDGGLITQWDIV